MNTQRTSRARSGVMTAREEGFTLVELMIVTVVIPVIVGALSIALVSVFSLQSSVSNRLGDSANSQVVTTSFTADVQSATQITTDPTLSTCGVGTQLMGLQVPTTDSSGNTTTAYVSYNEVLSSGSSYSLVRNECSDSGSLNSPVSIQTLAYNLQQPCSATVTSKCQGVPVIATNPTTTLPSDPASSWVSTMGITSVSLPLDATTSSYNYVVAAEPLGASTNGAGGTIAAGSTCGFALPGTGTYASQLCFFDFLPYLSGPGLPTNTKIKEYVPGGYVFTANLTITTSNSTVHPSAFPTYPAAFLGNAIGGTPFYTGVGCPSSDPTTVTDGSGNVTGQPSCISPAIYMYANGSSSTATITLTNITLMTPANTYASGYEIVTADAETTDKNPESITWSYNIGFGQVPDSPTSPEGNACSLANPDGTATGGGTDLTPNPVNNATTVTCNDTYQQPSNQPRTGTVILDVAPPTNASGATGANGSTSMTVVLASNGGKEAVSFGLLLP